MPLPQLSAGTESESGWYTLHDSTVVSCSEGMVKEIVGGGSAVSIALGQAQVFEQDSRRVISSHLDFGAFPML